MADQRTLRFATALLLAAWLLTVVVGLFHAEGFAAANTIPTLSAYVLWLAWSVWLLVTAWRPRQSAGAAVGPAAGL